MRVQAPLQGGPEHCSISDLDAARPASSPQSLAAKLSLPTPSTACQPNTSSRTLVMNRLTTTSRSGLCNEPFSRVCTVCPARPSHPDSLKGIFGIHVELRGSAGTTRKMTLPIYSGMAYVHLVCKALASTLTLSDGTNACYGMLVALDVWNPACMHMVTSACWMQLTLVALRKPKVSGQQSRKLAPRAS